MATYPSLAGMRDAMIGRSAPTDSARLAEVSWA